MNKYDLSKGDTVLVTHNGILWFGAVFDSWVKGLDICWVLIGPRQDRESFSVNNVKPTPETETKYTPIPKPTHRGELSTVNDNTTDHSGLESD